MKKHITAIFLIILLLIFIIFITISNRYSTVYQVLSPTEIELLPQHKAKASNELLCITDIESFSLNPDEKFVKKYSKKYNLPYSDIVGLGFLAQDYSQKLLQNRRVTVKYSHKNTSSCSYAKIKLNGMDYAELLANSGFGITKGKIRNEEKFKQNLEKARKLNLVILNHHSGKYHTLDCPYGQVAHDSVIIPINQLPDGVKPCKFCHDVTNKNKQPLYKKATNIFNIPNIKKPLLSVFDDNIKMIFTDFTETLKPNNECSSDVCKALVTFINETQETLDIAIYGYENNPAITSALINAKTRGVNIRFVYDRTYKDQNNHYKNNDIIENLSSAANSDISISATYSNMIMHNKFLISDNKKVFTGSMNISASGLSNFDVNNIIIINSKEVASLYTKEFEQMLDGKFHNAKSKNFGVNKFTIGNSEIEVYFSPKDNCTARIVEVINNAESYIYIPTFLVTHRAIAAALIEAQKRGVDVRILMDANGATTSHSKIKDLRDNNILLKTENFAGKLHTKSIIIDDKYIISGSMNFSYSGTSKNDENVLVIKNENLAKAYKNFFLYIWTKIPNKYLKQNAKPESPESYGSCTDGVDNNFNGKIDAEEQACTKI